MDRIGLIKQLENYKPYDGSEILMKDEIITFIKKNDDFFDHHLQIGHITASAWILNKESTHALLTKHILLDRWYQLGGHIENDETIRDVAFREATEECGLQSLTLLSDDIFSVDIHTIPATIKMKAHTHYDIRFLFSADMAENLVMSSESKDLKWIPLGEIKFYSSDAAIARMVSKSLNLNAI